jgi:hypothetical protein
MKTMSKQQRLTVPSFVQVEIEDESEVVSVFDRFPANIVSRYSGLAQAQLPLTQTEWTRKGIVAVMALTSAVPDANSLRYVLQFLRKLHKEVYGFPQIHSPGVFSFSEAALMYRTVLRLQLPWEQHLLRDQLLQYMFEKALKMEEIGLVWENIPRNSAVVWKMLERYIYFVKEQKFEGNEEEKVKRYLKSQPELLAALDRRWQGSRLEVMQLSVTT